MKHFLFLFSIILFFQTSAQTNFQGLAKGYENWTIRLITYQDYFTYQEKILAETHVDSVGNFELNCDVKETQFCLLKIGKTLGGIYVEPNTSYSVNFPQVDSIAMKYMQKESYVTIDIQADQALDLNKLIRRFDSEYGKFTSDNIVAFVKKSARNVVDTFALNRQKAYSGIQNEYFQNYVNYNLARLKFSAYKSKKELYQEYLKGQPILYRNDSYMEFINLFYKDYFKTLPLVNYDKLVEAVTVKMNPRDISELMLLKGYLEDTVLTELILIRSLYENFHAPDFSRKSILYVLNEINSQSTEQEHTQITWSVRNKLSGVEKGSYAPDFELVDLEGNKVMLSDYYKDKYVYIDFWATWCKPCVREMKLTTKLHKNYGKDVVIVSISIDKRFRSMKKFANKNKYKWTFLHWNGNDELKEVYKLNAIPLYYLIAPGGKVIYSPAPRPSKIESKFQRIKEQGLPKRKPFELIRD